MLKAKSTSSLHFSTQLLNHLPVRQSINSTPRYSLKPNIHRIHIIKSYHLPTTQQNSTHSNMSSFTSTPPPLPPPAFVIDSTAASITFQYPPYPSAVRYTISIKSDNEEEFIGEDNKDEEGWVILSKSFKGLKIKKHHSYVGGA